MDPRIGIRSDRIGMVSVEWERVRSGSGTAAVVRSPPVLPEEDRTEEWPRRAAPVGPVKGRSVRVSSPRRRAGPRGPRGRRRRSRIRSRRIRRGGVRHGARSASAWCRDRCTAGSALKDRRGRIGGGEAGVTSTAWTSSPSPDPNGLVDVRGVLTRPSSTAVLFLCKCSRSRRSRSRSGKGERRSVWFC